MSRIPDFRSGPSSYRPPVPGRHAASCRDEGLRDLLLFIDGRGRKARRRLMMAGLEARPADEDRAGPPPDSTLPSPRGDASVDTGAEAAADAGADMGARADAAEAAEAGTVLSLRRFADDLVAFTLARPEGFDYKAGDSVKLALDNVERTYSLVSAPHERDLEFFIELLPNGRMAARLETLRPGGRMQVANKAKSGLSLDSKASRHLMLATVTGVNPFVSLLRDAEHRGLRDLNCILVHGASYGDEFGYREELEALAARRPDLLTYIPTVSRPQEARNAAWAGATGRADSLIGPVCERYGLSPDDTAAYACGNPGMVDNARKQLGESGFRVRTEKYS